MSFNSNEMTFFERFEQNILNGSKTITIRDKSEKDYYVGSRVKVFTNETHRYFATIQILSVTPVFFEELNEQHAQQENMSLTELKQVIADIYPNEQQFYVIYYQLVSE